MKANPTDIQHIKIAFSKMGGKEDLLDLINFTKKILFGEKSVPFEMRHINYHSNLSANPNRYKKFAIKKKSGGVRTIYSPNKGLKAIQTCLNFIFQTIYNPHLSANGFVPGKSILDNALRHVGNIYVFNIDLKDFFPSIDQARLWGRLQHPPFNLAGTPSKLIIANVISALCCHNILVERKNEDDNWVKVKKNVLPQGAPTSPVISNIICQNLDFYLSAVARRFGLRYSRYADDITFSSMHNVYQKNSDFLTEINRIITGQNFHIKESKTRLQKDDYRQMVTGLVVNEVPNVPRRYVIQIRQCLYFWDTYGYEKASEIFINKYTADKTIRNGAVEMETVLKGKLDFLKMIKGSENNAFVTLNERFNQLVAQRSIYKFKPLQIDPEAIMIHSPAETVKFLKYFKYDNIYTFKQLVHRPLEGEQLKYISLIRKANQQFKEIINLNGGRLSLPKQLIEDVQQFFKILNESGVEFFMRTGMHPLENSDIGKKVQKFKGDYRFGNEKSESSILSDLIINIAKKVEYKYHQKNEIFSFGETDTSGLFNISQIKFYPDLFKFQSKANFFTWVPNVRIALFLIFEMILKHSNIGGRCNKRKFNKEISFEITRQLIGDNIKVDLIVFDKKSIFLGETTNLLSDMRRDFFKLLVGICDFKIQFNTAENDNYECQILPYSKETRLIKEEISGFKYIFSFYD